MIINYNEEIEKLNKLRSGEIKTGYRLGVHQIDEYFRFKTGNFNVILGQANVGKTSMVLYLMLLYTIKHKIRWLVFSSENEPHSIIRKLIEYLTGTVLEKIDAETYKWAIDLIKNYFNIISPEKLYTYKDMIILASNLKKAWNYHGFLIDPYNSLIKDGEMSKNIGGHEYDYQATTELRQFCKKNDVSIWLNVHAVTSAIRTTHRDGHEYHGYPIPPTAGDVEGGAKFVNRADDFMVFHRYVQHPTDWNQTHIHVRKIKETETGGRPTPLDSPIRLKSILNNVGFEIDGQNLLNEMLNNKRAETFLKKA